MTLEDFAKILIKDGKFDIKVDVYSSVSGNKEPNNTTPKTVIFSDQRGNEIARTMVNP